MRVLAFEKELIVIHVFQKTKLTRNFRNWIYIVYVCHITRNMQTKENVNITNVYLEFD